MKSWAGDTEKSQDAVGAMTPRRNAKRKAYKSTPTRDLRTIFAERKLGEPYDLKRADMILLLEQDDNRASTWVESQAFEVFFLFVVFLNAIAIVCEIDHPDSLEVSHFDMLNVTFLTLFSAEVVLKVVALGWRRYAKDYWNIFDLVVTALAAVQICGTYILRKAYLKHVNQYIAGDCVQIMRLCRLMRFARVFPQLGILIRSFLLSLKGVFWIFMLLTLWFFLTGCFATLFLGRRGLHPSEDKADLKKLQSNFATIPLSMFALFEIMTLEGWTDYVRPLLHTRPVLVFFFLAFIFITAFFMLNLITAVIVDRTRAAEEEEHERESKEAQLQRKIHINDICQSLWHENRTAPESDLITHEEFQTIVWNCVDISEALEELAWTKRYLTSMFNCLDHDDDGRTSITSLQKFLEISDQPLDAASYMRFQNGLTHRLEHQEKLLLKMMGALEDVTKQKLECPPRHAVLSPREQPTSPRSKPGL